MGLRLNATNFAGNKSFLFNFNFCTCFFELSFKCISFVFAHTFLDSLRSCINEFLSFLQAEACEFLHEFHNTQLGGAG